MTAGNSALTLASINIERSKHLARVEAFLRIRSAAVVCLQEVIDEDLAPLCDRLGYAHRLYVPMCRFPEHGTLRPSGIAILSRLPLARVENIQYAGGGSGTEPLDRTSEETRFATIRYALAIAEVEHGGQMFTIATTHFPWTNDARTSDFQRSACDALLRLAGNRSLLLTGDFNAPRGREIFGRLAARWKDHIPSEYTSSIDPQLHRAPHLELMVDGLFSTDDYDVRDVALHTGVSDHRAVVAAIRKRQA
jgi:endonuclease/exonuclease/phosphatase family metal-dependent hydrolase